MYGTSHLSISCNWDKNTGWTRTGDIVILVHTNGLNPFIVPSSFASPGLKDLVSYNDPKKLILELYQHNLPNMIKNCIVVPPLSLFGGNITIPIPTMDDATYNLVTIVTKISPSQSLFTATTLVIDKEVSPKVSPMWVYDANVSREQHPTNEPRQSATAFDRITTLLFKGFPISVGNITYS